MRKTVMYFVSGTPEDDIETQQVIRLKTKDERDFKAGRANPFLLSFAGKIVRTVKIFFPKDESDKSDQLRVIHSLIYFDENGVECQQEKARLAQAAQSIYTQIFDDSWSRVVEGKESSHKNQFDVIEFERLYIWKPTLKEQEYLANAILKDLKLDIKSP